MDLSHLKIDVLEKDQSYLFTVPVEWLIDNRINEFAEVLRSRNIKGVIVGGEVSMSKLVEIFKNASQDKKTEILEALGKFEIDPISHEQTK